MTIFKVTMNCVEMELVWELFRFITEIAS